MPRARTASWVDHRRPGTPGSTARRIPDRWADVWRTWLGAALLMIGIWALTSLAVGHAIFFWPAAPIGFWALALIASRRAGRHPHGC